MSEQENSGENQNTSQDGGAMPSFDEWLQSADEGVQNLVAERFRVLEGALTGEREQRTDLARQLREATGALEEGSTARQQLEGLSDELESANRRADFFAEAARPETGCTNPRLAWLTAQDIEAFDRRGNVDWEAVKKAAPELFQKAGSPPGNAGTGTGSGGAPAGGDVMDDIIRRKAGAR